MARIVTIIGTRPEIIKMAPVVKALDGLRGHEHLLVHSGQHYDLLMDRIFFQDMELREPDRRFELRDQPPHLQVATTMRQIADVTEDADLVIVHGDTNTTVAGALLASKQDRCLAHVEAGIRSFDKTMPEEVNRIVADQLSQLLFAPTPVSKENLRRENVTTGVHVVGNSVVDALVQNAAVAERKSTALKTLGLSPRGYLVLTFHRAENVDSKDRLAQALDAFDGAVEEAGLPILFPIHPRTAKRLKEFGLEKRAAAIGDLRRVEPTGYLDMLALEKNAALVMTDSGGLQEESCYFQIPCVTLRENTERPETLEIGANVLAGTEPARVRAAVRRQIDAKRGWPNPYGDGTTSRQIAAIVSDCLG
jgi:UDP-N-acetylglucosamine 2-epimerase (non-hydrolysing)